MDNAYFPLLKCGSTFLMPLSFYTCLAFDKLHVSYLHVTSGRAPLAVHRDSERREKIPFVGFCNTETTKVEGIILTN